jgi:hypothetical protein
MNENNRMNILAGTNNSIIKALEESTSKDKKILEAIEIIDKYEYLQKAFKYILLNSKSNNGPYHNLNHLLTVLKYCYLGGLSEGIKDEKELRELLIAAIFHDVNHTIGKEKDDVNVQNSKDAIGKFVKQEEIDADTDYMNKLLDATQYPYVIEGKDLDLKQGIIRDADLMQVFEYNWIHQNIAGLSSELKMDFLDFVQPQRKFLESAAFNTTWGKKMYKERWGDVMKQYEMFERACNIELKK